MTYPETELKNDAPDALYGGRPALEFGGLAWQWVCNVIDFLERAHLAHNRQAYRTLAPVVTGALAPGEVAVLDFATPGVSGGYIVRKAVSGDSGNADVRPFGVCITGAASGRRAIIATAGLVPRSITGFASNTAQVGLALNYTNSRLKVAGTGDTVIAYSDVLGNALLALEP